MGSIGNAAFKIDPSSVAPGTPKIGSAYVRVSTDDQLEYSPASQLKTIREHARRMGYVIPDEFVYREEDGISGKSADKRPQFRLMIATAKQDTSPFEAIFVWKYSRFARNQEEAIMYKNLLKKKGVSVVSISEPSSDSPFASLIERIIEWMDEYYLINLASEVRRGMTEKSTRGEAMGRAPFGYRVENKKYVPDANAGTVHDIFEQYAAGKTMREIAVALGESGVRTSAGKAPNIYMVSYVLRNPAYIGKLRWTTEDHEVYRSADYLADESSLVEGRHEAIIDKALWDAVQARLKDRPAEVKYVRRDNPTMFMLKGLVRCSECGATLTERKERNALQCYRYSRGQCHTTHYIPIKTANEAVLTGLAAILSSESFVFSEKPETKKAAPRDWDKLIASEQSRLRRAKEGFLAGVFSASECKEIQAEVEDNVRRMEQTRDAEHAAAQTAPQRDITRMKHQTADVLAILKSPDTDEATKNKALHSIIDKILYNKAENTFDFYFLP